jgi:hypothetical protein
VTAPEEVAVVEVIPTAIEAHLDDVAGELLERRCELVELGGVRDAAAVGLLEGVAVHVGDEPHAVAPAHGAVVESALTDVAAGAQQLGMRVADVAKADRAALEVPQDRSARQCVVDVHGRSVRARHGSACARARGDDAGRTTRVGGTYTAALPPGQGEQPVAGR